MLPPKERMCHLCGFTQSCRDLVTSERCGRWATLTCEAEDGKGEVKAMCLDDMALGMQVRTQKLMNQVVGSIDALRVETARRHEINLASAAMVTQEVRTMQERLEAATSGEPLRLSAPSKN